MSSGSTSRPGRRTLRRTQHLLLVREMLERAGFDDASDTALSGSAARARRRDSERRIRAAALRGPDENVVVEHSLARRGSRWRRWPTPGNRRRGPRGRARGGRGRSRASSSPMTGRRSPLPADDTVAALCTRRGKDVRRKLVDDCLFSRCCPPSTGSAPGGAYVPGRRFGRAVVSHCIRAGCATPRRDEAERDCQADPAPCRRSRDRRPSEAHCRCGSGSSAGAVLGSPDQPARARLSPSVGAPWRRRSRARSRSHLLRAVSAGPDRPRKGRGRAPRPGAELVPKVRRGGPDEGVDVGDVGSAIGESLKG